MAVENIPCGGFHVDGDTIVFVSVKGQWIMSTTPKSEYNNVVKIPCGGYYIDADVFKLTEDGVLTKTTTMAPVMNIINVGCGGFHCDAEAFKFEKGGLSLIP